MRLECSEPLAAWIFPRQGTQCGYHSTKSNSIFPELQQSTSTPGTKIVCFLLFRAQYSLVLVRRTQGDHRLSADLRFHTYAF